MLLHVHLPDASREYWRDRKELLSLEIAVVKSGCETVLSRLPLVRPHLSQRDLRSPSTPLQEKHQSTHSSCIKESVAL